MLDFTDLESERAYDPFLAYSRSKLANLLFTYELVRRHGDELIVTQRTVPFDATAVIEDLQRRRHPNTEFVTSILTGQRR